MNAASSVDYMDQADRAVSAAVRAAYVKGLGAGHIVSLVCSGIAILSSTFIRERRL